MPAKSPGRTRLVDVDVPLDLRLFVEKLARATRWEGDFAQFIGREDITPGSHAGEWSVDNPCRFAVNYLWREMLSKYDDGSSSKEKADRAMEKFAEAEEMCATTNLRLIALGARISHPVTSAEKIIRSAQKKISSILGDFSWQAASRGFSFTSGASTRLPRAKGAIPYKYSGTPETTFGNANLAWSIISATPAWKRRLCSEEGPMHLSLVHGNRVTTVPKNYKVDRVIAIEPDMNMYVQKGLGTMIRRRLKQAGLDLNTQETNQQLAHIGSVDDSLATIDMSMASDTVSLELVRLLLPAHWVEALEMCRSPFGVLPCGKRILYRKFSSMGNGYTFELETLIFWGLALAVVEHYGLETHRTVVYGDDVILPAPAAATYCELLALLGFKVNEDKTFVSGSFRESCGKHYLSGVDVTPFYIKEKVNALSQLFLLHNRLFRWCVKQRRNTQVDWPLMADLLKWLRDRAPSNWRRPRLPDGYGDGAFIGTFDQAVPKVACTYRPGGRLGVRDGWEGYVCRVLASASAMADFHTEGYGVLHRERLRHVPRGPEVVGRLLHALSRGNSQPPGRMGFNSFFALSFEESGGGVSLPPRARIVDMIVPQWTLDEDLTLLY
jgi:hypothetical protein